MFVALHLPHAFHAGALEPDIESADAGEQAAKRERS